ncbi:aspartate aminotransferase family protein [Bosea sp. NPDC055353]
MNKMQTLRSADIINAERRSIWDLAPGHDNVVWAKAAGARVTDVDGRDYIDFSSGVLVANTGHCHPHVVKAIQEQAGLLLNCYDAPHPLRAQVAERLLGFAGGRFDAVSLATTGAEAIDSAVKIAKAATKRYEIISFADGFHGKSISTASLSGMPGNRRSVGPLVPGSIVVPFPNSYRRPAGTSAENWANQTMDMAEEMIRINSTGQIAAIVVEPFLGAGGAHVAPPVFWKRLRALADKLQALVIMDEVQAAFGRTGQFFAFQGLGIEPDLLCVAKGIASGIPMSAIIGRKALFDALPAGVLSSTYGGNPLACAACLATLDVIEQDNLVARARDLTQTFHARFATWVKDIPGVGDARGMGLSMGIELVVDNISKTPDPARALRVVKKAAEDGLIVLPPSGSDSNVVRLAPPLVLTDAEAEEGLRRLEDALRCTISNQPAP